MSVHGHPAICLGTSHRHWAMLVAIAAALGAIGCRSTEPQVGEAANVWAPSHDREWIANLAELPRAQFSGRTVKLFNVRDTRYLSNDDYVVQHFDREFALNELERVDFIVVPFKGAPSLAHTMLSFGFSDGDQVVISAEARLEENETYSPLRGAMRQYELMYVVATERDVIPLRTKHRDVEVYVYESTASAEQARELFVDMLERVNRINEQPEFYDTLTNNCTSNIVQHINRIRPSSLSMFDPRLLLPGYSDQIAFESGLIRSRGGYYATRRQANVTERSNRFASAADFSQRIRR